MTIILDSALSVPILVAAFLFLSSSLHVMAAAFCGRQRCGPASPPKTPPAPRLLLHHGMNSLARGGGGANTLVSSSRTSDNAISDGGGGEVTSTTVTTSKQLFQFYTMSNGMCPYAGMTTVARYHYHIFAHYHYVLVC
jgi:hypothetical protein